MKYITVNLRKILGFWLLFLFSITLQAADRDVCISTDMSTDADDMGALQLALYYHHTDQINLRCVIFTTTKLNGQGYRVIRDMIEWWGYNIGDIEIGTYTGDAPLAQDDSRWIESYLIRYPVDHFDTEDGSTLLNRKLNEYPGMTIIEIGPAVTVYDASARDKISYYVQMAGHVNDPSFGEFNAAQFPEGIQYIDDRNQVDWYDHVLGFAVRTGGAAFNHDTRVKYAYDTHHNASEGIPSFDLLAVLGTVTGDQFFSFQNGIFTFSYSSPGGVWNSSFGTQRLARHKNIDATKNEINRILRLRPQDVPSQRSKDKIIFIEYGDYLIPIIK